MYLYCFTISIIHYLFLTLMFVQKIMYHHPIYFSFIVNLFHNIRVTL